LKLFYHFLKLFNIFKTRFCSKLNLPKPVQKLAELIVNKASNIESINGRSPVSLAAACIYIASEVTGNDRTLEEISKITGAAVTTIRSKY
jgi:transcription initiation factor TFIIB